MAILQVEELTMRFGGLVALSDVGFELAAGEIAGVIGPNGAGKTTLINVISGIYHPTAGRVRYQGREITGMPAHQRSRIGIGRTFQIIHPLENLDLLENVMVAGLFARGLSVAAARVRAEEICAFLGLRELRRPVARLTILEIKKLEIAHALAGAPKLLFLDEIMAGLSLEETAEMIQAMQEIRRAQGVAICVVEHVMSVIKELTSRVIVLDGGQIIAQGPYEVVGRNPRVINAYLGAEA
jgi:branched-chain amino acid transport system ATP-binding protein